MCDVLWILSCIIGQTWLLDILKYYLLFNSKENSDLKYEAQLFFLPFWPKTGGNPLVNGKSSFSV